MAFEIGKCYEHTCGEMISVVGKVETTLYGECLVAESNYGSDLKPIGTDDYATANWTEITKGRWLTSFSREDNLPPHFKETVLCIQQTYPDKTVFPREVVEQFLRKIKDQNIKIFGTIITRSSENNQQFEVAHEVKNLRIQGAKLVGDIYIEGSPKGWELWDAMQHMELDFKCVTNAEYELFERTGTKYAKNLEITAIHAYPRGFGHDTNG